MKEIGSEFWDIPTSDKQNECFPKHTQWFLSGRSALNAIITELKDYHTVALPSWCCDSMIKPFESAGFDVRFYPVYWENNLIQDRYMDCDVLFVMDYFGYTSQTEIPQDYSGVVIRDITHSLFSNNYADADYSFGSLRKWCGVWTGGYAWTKDGHSLEMALDKNKEYVCLRKKAMEDKALYIKECSRNDLNQKIDKGYLESFKKAELLLDNIGTQSAEIRDIWMAKHLNVDFMKTRRRSNARILQTEFAEWLVFAEDNPNDCPMFVPVIVPGNCRNDLQDFLIRNRIYCPVHWPLTENHRMDSRELFLYNNELSLVCDQRYTEEDMYRLIGTIKTFMEEG